MFRKKLELEADHLEAQQQKVRAAIALLDSNPGSERVFFLLREANVITF